MVLASGAGASLALLNTFSEIHMRIPTRVIGSALIVTLLAQLTACGTILYPERRGQIGGKIDPVVAAMDAIGILFYVIPGLIAFGIDFATGAIYYSGGRKGPGRSGQAARGGQPRWQGRQPEATSHPRERTGPTPAVERPTADPASRQHRTTCHPGPGTVGLNRKDTAQG